MQRNRRNLLLGGGEAHGHEWDGRHFWGRRFLLSGGDALQRSRGLRLRTSKEDGFRKRQEQTRGEGRLVSRKDNPSATSSRKKLR